jgi:hypothetical protein
MVKNQSKSEIETARIQSQAPIAQQAAAQRAQQAQSDAVMENQRLMLEIKRLEEERRASESKLQLEIERMKTNSDMAKAQIAEILARIEAMGGQNGPQ